MATIPVPDYFPQTLISWRAPALPAQVNRSAWTGKSKVVGLPGTAVWAATITFPQMELEQGRIVRAFMLSLNGPVNNFRLESGEPQQTEAANPTVRSGTVTATTLPLQGLPNSAAVLSIGMMITIPLPSGRVHFATLTAPLNSNGSGQGTATFMPELDEAPVLGATVEIRNPYALMRLQSGAGWDFDVRHLMQFGLEVEEAK